MQVSLDDIKAAQKVLRGRIIRTPLIPSPLLSAQLKADVWLKPENWQTTGSFKIRGAYTKIGALTKAERARGIITASAGNHAQGVALAGKILGVSTLIVVPDHTPETKLQGIRQHGADVIIHGRYYDDAETFAWNLSRETGRVFIHAFEDPAIVAGQGTVGLEIFEDLQEVDAIVIPAGGGGLLCGIGVAAKNQSPDTKIIGVQSEASAAWHAAFEAGAIVPVSYQETWAEGLLGGIGGQNFAMAQSLVERIELVTEPEIQETILWALTVHHMLLEGSAAVSLAYALYHAAERFRGQTVVLVLTGSNIDLGRVRQLLNRSS